MRTLDGLLGSQCAGSSASFRPRGWLRETTAWGAVRKGLKSEAAKECVTTHLPNQPALKMDEYEYMKRRGVRKGVRKVTTGITGFWRPSVHSDVAF